jgi:hypothetical protein
VMEEGEQREGKKAERRRELGDLSGARKVARSTEKMFREIIVSSHVVKFDCHISSRKMFVLLSSSPFHPPRENR